MPQILYALVRTHIQIECEVTRSSLHSTYLQVLVFWGFYSNAHFLCWGASKTRFREGKEDVRMGSKLIGAHRDSGEACALNMPLILCERMQNG